VPYHSYYLSRTRHIHYNSLVHTSRRSHILLLLLSAAMWVAIRLLSAHFTWGQEHLLRPILLFVALCWLQWLIYYRQSLVLATAQSARRTPILLFTSGLALNLLFLGAKPIQEHDAYRYLWDGAVQSQGINPYRFAPSIVHDAHPGGPRAAKLRALANSSALAGQNFSRISYSDVPTIYPPVALVSFRVAYAIGGWSWDGLRLFYVSAYFLGAWFVILALTSRGADRSSPIAPCSCDASHAAFLLAWCPLIIKEVGNSAHVDALVILFFGALILLLTRATAGIGTAAIAGVLLALATLSKLYPAMLLPLVVAYFFNVSARRFTAVTVLICAFIVAVLLGYAPFIGDGSDVFAGLKVFTNTWHRNAGAYAVLEMICTAAFGRDSVSLPWPGGSGELGSVVAKFFAHLILLLSISVCALSILRSRDANEARARLWRACTYTLLCWFLLLPMAYPWYLIGLIPFVVLSGIQAAWVLMASVFCAYYLLFFVEYHGYPASVELAVRAVEYAIPTAYVLFTVFRRQQESPGEPVHSETT
jgi:hypothetical protein